MRVISGRLGGRRLHAPASQDTRPSSQRVRTALFDRLGSRVVGARVLDLYAGSGALGIEALSRGAAHGIFVEHARGALAALRRNLGELGLGSCSRVLSEDVERAVERLCAEGARFELVLLDPPYQLGRVGDRSGAGRDGAAARATPSRDASARESAKFATVGKRARAELLRARPRRAAGDAAAIASATLSVLPP